MEEWLLKILISRPFLVELTEKLTGCGSDAMA